MGRVLVMTPTVDQIINSRIAQRQEREQLERQCGLHVAECWYAGCGHQVAGVGVDDAYERLADHLQSAHGMGGAAA